MVSFTTPDVASSGRLRKGLPSRELRLRKGLLTG